MVRAVSRLALTGECFSLRKLSKFPFSSGWLWQSIGTSGMIGTIGQACQSIVTKLCLFSPIGHNIFGEDIVKTLKNTTNVKERSKYILMDKIQPPVTKNYIVRAELPKPVLADVISELGFFGILIRYVIEYY